MKLQERYDAIKQSEQYKKVISGLKCGVYGLSIVGMVGGSSAYVVGALTQNQDLANIGAYVFGGSIASGAALSLTSDLRNIIKINKEGKEKINLEDRLKNII
jgi:hypothetical protein